MYKKHSLKAKHYKCLVCNYAFKPMTEQQLKANFPRHCQSIKHQRRLREQV